MRMDRTTERTTIRPPNATSEEVPYGDPRAPHAHASAPAPAPNRESIVYRKSLGVGNVFAVRGRRTILVDAGVPGSGAAIARWLRRHGIEPADLSLIVLTHAHRDHLGSAAELRERFTVPIALHGDGWDAAHRGRDRYGAPSGWFARHVVARFPKAFPPLEPDIVLTAGQRLDDFGVAAEVLATPGHTDHCISVVTDAGDAIVGDLFVGSHVLPNRAGVPYLIERAATWRESAASVYHRSPARLHPGHGKSFDLVALARLNERGYRI